jgi:hypothetical protein
MGACSFTVLGHGTTAREAFREAVEDAQHESGHGGYTGTIAEKREYHMVTPRDGETAEECAERLLEAGDRATCDKWGPAGCIRVTEGVYLFFGMASS